MFVFVGLFFSVSVCVIFCRRKIVWLLEFIFVGGSSFIDGDSDGWIDIFVFLFLGG